MKKRIPLIIDLLFVFILLPAMCLLLPIEKWLVNNLFFVSILVCWLYAIYFLNRNITMPMLFKSKKHVLIALGILVATAVVTWYISQYQMDFPHRGIRTKVVRGVRNASKLRLHQQAVWFLYVIVTVFSIAVGLFKELYRQMLRTQSLEYEKKKAELALYKAQINPHFLFNTLNTLYGMILLKSKQVETAFQQFISLMRYMYTNPTRDYIPVEQEIDYIREYIEIQKYRTDNQDLIHFSYVHDSSKGNLQIVPMLLITFVENALKYGLSSCSESPVYITIRIEEEDLYFSTENKKCSEQSSESGGIGIENCRKRLKLSYPNRHELQIDEDKENFRVNLHLKLSETNSL